MTTKVAIITGSTSGIGLGIAKKFALEGYNLIINGIDDNGEKLAENLAKESKTEVIFNGADLTKSSGCNSLIEQAKEKWHRIDVLINNAGMQFVSSIEEFPEQKWEQIIALNLSAAFYTTKYAFPIMKAQKHGTIINIASVHGLVASEFKSAYVAAKHGLIGLTKVTALEGANFNITANAICPGYVKTPLVEGQIKNQAIYHGISEKEVIEKILLAKHAIKDFVSIESIAELCFMLASPTGRLITGSSITIDGGWTAQ
jgi:3-hydroxybutyrate dehydrogenase